jgi:hypothetical protein
MARGLSSVCSHELLVWSAPVLVAGGFVYWSGLFHAFGLTSMFHRYGVSMLVKVVVGAVLTFATTQWSSNRARLNWEKQEFLKRVQISLNYVADEDGLGRKLRFRTLDECGVDELMNQNSAGIAKILSAARSTTSEDPFLRSDPHSMDLIMKAVTNRISVKFATGYLDYYVGSPVIRKEYWLGLTCEKPDAAKGERFDVKLRVMVTSDNLLRRTNWDKERGSEFFERPPHASRWECLKKMRKVLDQDGAEQLKGGQFWRKQLLRKVTVFRPLHFNDSNHPSILSLAGVVGVGGPEGDGRGSDIITKKRVNSITRPVARGGAGTGGGEGVGGDKGEEEKDEFDEGQGGRGEVVITRNDPALRDGRGRGVMRKRASSIEIGKGLRRNGARPMLKEPSSTWHVSKEE